MNESSRFLRFFIEHRTAANLLMLLMMAVGLLSLDRLNRQFFPSFEVEGIWVSVAWTGATAEDVDANIVQLLEPELRNISNVKKVISNSYEGLGSVQVDFKFGADMKKALSDVENAVSQVDFPQQAETPKIVKGEFFEPISRLVLSGPFSMEALRRIAKEIKEDLQRLGVDKVRIKGLAEEEIRIEVSETELARYGMSLSDISAAISRSSLDVPAGRLADGALRVRSLGLRRTAAEYEEVEVRVNADGSRVLLGDIARITEGRKSPSVDYRFEGSPAVEIQFSRSANSDALTVNGVVQEWLEKFRSTAPQSLVIEQFDVRANLIQERINLLVKNGIGGLMLVMIVLFLFLSSRVAIWVAAGIPVAFLATFGVMLAMGQSINMISLFGLIMALGIVVDDAIVIGEHTEYLSKHRRLPMHEAAALAATRMSAPVVSAMLTTVAAFLPLFTIKGIIGEIISAIPMVVVAVLIASLMEVFFILPAHLAHFGSGREEKIHGFRYQFNRLFNAFRDGPFRSLVTLAVRWHLATMAFAVGLLILAIGMMAGGRVNFVFFDSPEADIAYANVLMVPGTSRSQTVVMLEEVEQALERAEASITDGKGGLIKAAVGIMGTNLSQEEDPITTTSDISASVMVELITADRRQIRMRDFLAAWRNEVGEVAGLERLTIRAPAGGPPGRDIDIRLMGDDLEVLKKASQELVQLVKTIPSASGVAENLTYGAEERIIKLTPLGTSLGFSVASVGQQLRAALDGAVVTRFPRGDEEVTVRLMLPADEISTDSIERLRLIAPDGRFVPLADIATVEDRLGFSVVRRQDGFREVAVSADLDASVINTDDALAKAEEAGLPALAERYGLRYRYDGRDQEQQEAFADMATGAMLALICIYVILAWVFSSWLRPFAVMIMIPFALIGAVVGHYVMGLTMTILSMFALIALAGIVVNNSIILVATIERRMAETEGDRIKAIISGAVDRLRPVILTSVTTICGLSTLMFETSLQAQFLIPMATTIVFGLGVTTLLVLFVVPAALAIGNDLGRGGVFIRNFFRRQPHAAE